MCDMSHRSKSRRKGFISFYSTWPRSQSGSWNKKPFKFLIKYVINRVVLLILLNSFKVDLLISLAASGFCVWFQIKSF